MALKRVAYSFNGHSVVFDRQTRVLQYMRLGRDRVKYFSLFSTDEDGRLADVVTASASSLGPSVCLSVRLSVLECARLGRDRVKHLDWSLYAAELSTLGCVVYFFIHLRQQRQLAKIIKKSFEKIWIQIAIWITG